MENNTQEENNTIYITNIKWHMTYSVKSTLSSSEELPNEYSLSIPGYLMQMKNAADPQKEQKFRDEIETFVYNFLSKKFGAECSYCQIWLPLKAS